MKKFKIWMCIKMKPTSMAGEFCIYIEIRFLKGKILYWNSFFLKGKFFFIEIRFLKGNFFIEICFLKGKFFSIEFLYNFNCKLFIAIHHNKIDLIWCFLPLSLCHSIWFSWHFLQYKLMKSFRIYLELSIRKVIWYYKRLYDQTEQMSCHFITQKHYLS